MKDKIKRIFNYVNRFIQSDYFIAFIGIMTFIGWYFKIWIEMLFVLLTVSIFPLFFFKGTKHLLALLMMFTFMISDNRHHLDAYKYYLIPFLLLLIGGFVVSLCRFKRDWSVLLPKKIKGFHVALILLIIPFAFGGVGSPSENPVAVVVAFLLVLVIGFGYTFFVVTNTGVERKNMMDYVLKILYVMGVVVIFEFIVHLSTYDSFETMKAYFNNKEWSLGWGAANNVAPVLAMAIPATLYLCVRKNKVTPIFVIISFIEITLIVITGCRGAMLFTVLTLPYMLCYIIGKSENKLSFSLTFGICCTVATILIAYYSNQIIQYVTSTASLGLSDNARFPLYREAIGYFKEHPIFGVGWDHLLGHRTGGEINNYTPRWYHSTLFQILANMGICGIIFFAIFYYWKYKSFSAVIKKPQGMALFTSLLIFDAYGMIDTNFFGPTFFIMLIIISFAVQCGMEDYQGLAFKAKPFEWIRQFIKKHERVQEPAD